MKLVLRDKRPQKAYLKIICNILYHLGLAHCWYEGIPKYSLSYKIFSVFVNVVGIVFILDGLVANFRTDLTFKERNDLFIFNFGFPAISLKVIILYIKREQIKVFLKKLLEDQVVFLKELDVKAVKGALVGYSGIVGAILLTSSVQLIVGVKDYFVEGVPVRVEVLYYPKATDTGMLANLIRVLAVLHFWFIICIMTVIDCLCLTTLIFIKFQFIRVRVFFENLGEIAGSLTVKEFKEEFLTGVALHKHALWCARNVQNTIGSIYSVQIVESVTLLVVFLLRVIYAGSDTMLFLVCLGSYFLMISLTGLYMMYSANITFEALQISTAIFHCGWAKVKIGSGLRKLIVVTLQQCQKPVYMTAFGVIDLSYENYIAILRGSYSFFIVMRDIDNRRA